MMLDQDLCLDNTIPVTWGYLLNHSEPHFLLCKIEIKVPTLQGCCEEYT